MDQLEQFKKEINSKLLRKLMNEFYGENNKTASSRATGARKRLAGDYEYYQDRGAFDNFFNDIQHGENFHMWEGIFELWKKTKDDLKENNNYKMKHIKLFEDFLNEVEKPPREFTENSWEEGKKIAHDDMEQIKKLMESLLKKFKKEVPEIEWSIQEDSYSYNDAYFGYEIMFKAPKSVTCRFLSMKVNYETERPGEIKRVKNKKVSKNEYEAAVYYYEMAGDSVDNNPTKKIYSTTMFTEKQIEKELLANMRERLSKAKGSKPW